MKKSLILKLLFCIIILILVASASVFATYTYLASNVSYGSTTVDNALNDLYALKGNNNNYSSEEQVIGKWINGKTIYRKIFTGTTPNTSKSNTTTSILISSDLDELISLKWILIDSNNYKIVGEGSLHTADSLLFAAWATPDNYIRVRAGSSSCCNRPVKYITEYTKTTN